MWTLRCLYELASWECAAFITLTYDDDHLPTDYSLKPEDLRNFWKRLRKRLGRKIKYYACGEYGEKEQKYLSPGATECHGRPHYHAIVFGLDPYDKDDRQAIIDSWRLCEEHMFNFERNSIAPVCREDIQYVCGYVQKKLNGDLGRAKYGVSIRPFSRVSHGIGLEFALENKERLLNNGYTFLGKQKVCIPRYFRDKFQVVNSELINVNKYKSVDNFKAEAEKLWEQFEMDMRKAGTWYPENLTQTSIRFKRWLDDFGFSLARQVEKDFMQFKHIRGKL